MNATGSNPPPPSPSRRRCWPPAAARRPPAALAPAQGSTLVACEALAASFAFARTTVTAATTVPAGELSAAGTAIGPHCRVTGAMNERVSPVDGKSYAIGFEMRLPNAWNGRFFYQANGGIDGSVVTATGASTAARARRTRWPRASPSSAPTPATPARRTARFGIDPQARLDYGYQAVAQAHADGQGADPRRLRQAPRPLVHRRLLERRPARARRRRALCPTSTTASWSATRATVLPLRRDRQPRRRPDLRDAWPRRRPTVDRLHARRAHGSSRMRCCARCDALDGAADGMVQDTSACQAAFDLDRDVPTCTGARDGTCLSARAEGRHRQAASPASPTRAGAASIASFPYDAGLGDERLGVWKFSAPPTRDAGAIGVHLAGAAGRRRPASTAAPSCSPPTSTRCSRKVQATDATYTESALSFMQPPRPERLVGAEAARREDRHLPRHQRPDLLERRHSVRSTKPGAAATAATPASFARLYLRAGHEPLPRRPGGRPVRPAPRRWSTGSSRARRPAAVTASVRGPGNAAGVNADVPADVVAGRGRGRSAPIRRWRDAQRRTADLESASAFTCR